MNQIVKMSPFRQLTRKFHTSKTLRDLPLDPIKPMDDFVSEKHIKPLIPLSYFLTFIAIPIGSAYMWYEEYQHLFVHKSRPPWPKHDFLNSQQRPYPWGDGERSAFFHPYYNFTKNGYVTDKEGNPLPKGVYAEE
ncbi:uncharacterized protein levy [Planococcus citri]|uniref:uncharacterized protein levy n=1 Tax=Planococcus citri TaxID=170843 RepID=UPI0031FA1D93